MRNVSYFSVVRQALSVPFFSVSVWIWGGLFAGAYAIGHFLFSLLPDPSDASRFASALENPSVLFSFIGWGCFSLAIHFLAKTGLFLSLQYRHKGKTSPARSRRVLPSVHSLGRGFVQMLGIECTAVFFLGLGLFIAFSPVAIAQSYNPNALSSVFLLAGFVSLLLVIAYTFTKEYAILYRLLSRLSLRSAFEAGGALFTRSLVPSLTLGFVLIGAMAIFTFLLNLVILGSATLERSIGQALFHIAGLSPLVLVTVAWIGIVYQSLWYYFFRALAAPRDTRKDEKNEAVAIERQMPQLPPASVRDR